MHGILPNLVLLLPLLLVFTQSHAYLIFKLTNAVCESYNKSWVVFNNCRLKAVQRNMTTLNINLELLHPANDVQFRLVVQKKANGYKPWLIDITFDLCQYMRKNNNAAVKAVFKLFQGFTTLNHTCPYMGVQLVKDFYPRPEQMTVPLPTGDYLVMGTLLFYQHPTVSLHVYFTFVEDFKRGRL